MTGTAMTESGEFQEIYSLDVVEIPTNRPMVRLDEDDVLYKTEAVKFKAIIEQILECNKKGQPVLVGTISVEKSELLSALLTKKGVRHEVLNAKNHAREAMIIAARDGRRAVTELGAKALDVWCSAAPDKAYAKAAKANRKKQKKNR